MRSSSGFLLSLDIERRDSRRDRVLILSGIVLSLAGLAHSGLPARLQLLSALLVLAGGWRELRRQSPTHPGRVVRLVVLPEGKFLVAVGAGRLQPVALTGYWLLPGFAVGLLFVDERGRRRDALLFRRDIPPAAWRRLAVRLRLTNTADERAADRG